MSSTQIRVHLAAVLKAVEAYEGILRVCSRDGLEVSQPFGVRTYNIDEIADILALALEESGE